jgi:hypothetical protein
MIHLILLLILFLLKRVGCFLAIPPLSRWTCHSEEDWASHIERFNVLPQLLRLPTPPSDGLAAGINSSELIDEAGRITGSSIERGAGPTSVPRKKKPSIPSRYCLASDRWVATANSNTNGWAWFAPGGYAVLTIDQRRTDKANSAFFRKWRMEGWPI